MGLILAAFVSCNSIENDAKKMAEIDWEYQRLRDGISGTIVYKPLEDKKVLLLKEINEKYATAEEKQRFEEALEKEM